MFSLSIGLALWTVVLVIAVGLWLYTIWDLSRRRDITLLQRVVWFVVTLVAPFVGVGAYWVLKPKSRA